MFPVVTALMLTACGSSGTGNNGGGTSPGDVSPGYTQVDGCSYLNDGMYAFKGWASYGATGDDTDFTGQDEVRELKISGGTLHLKMYRYPSSAPTLAPNKDSSNSAWNTPAKTYLFDIAGGTRLPRGDIAIVPADSISCSDNIATFSINGGTIKYTMQINANDVSGDTIIAHYPSVEKELTSPALTFASGSKLLEGVVTYVTKGYSMSEGNRSKVTDGNGNSLAGIDLSNIPNGQVFSFDQGNASLTLHANHTHTFTDGNGNVHTGTWALQGTGTRYITASDTIAGNTQCRYYFVVNSGELRYGTECDAGFKKKFGNSTNEDFMKEFSVNKTARDSIISNLHS